MSVIEAVRGEGLPLAMPVFNKDEYSIDVDEEGIYYFKSLIAVKISRVDSRGESPRLPHQINYEARASQRGWSLFPTRTSPYRSPPKLTTLLPHPPNGPQMPPKWPLRLLLFSALGQASRSPALPLVDGNPLSVPLSVHFKRNSPAVNNPSSPLPASQPCTRANIAHFGFPSIYQYK